MNYMAQEAYEREWSTPRRCAHCQKEFTPTPICESCLLKKITESNKPHPISKKDCCCKQPVKAPPDSNIKYCTACAAKMHKDDEICSTCGRPYKSPKSPLVQEHHHRSEPDFLLYCPDCGLVLYPSRYCTDCFIELYTPRKPQTFFQKLFRRK